MSSSTTTETGSVESQPYDADEIISIAPKLPELAILCVELSQPTWSENNVADSGYSSAATSAF